MFANVAECRALNNDMMCAVLHQGSEVLDVCQPSEELLWADSCHLLALLASSGPFLRLGAAACPILCTRSCTGLMFPNDCSSSSAQLSTGVCIGYLSTRGYANSRTGHLAYWTSCGLDNSRMPPATLRASFSFFWRHLRDCELSST